MSRVFWDTNIFIYLFEGTSESSIAARQLREKMLLRGDELLTSAMSVAEVQVQALRAGNKERAIYFRDLVRNAGKVVDFNLAAADTFAHLRATTALRPADAIQLSCASAAGVELFVTNDKALHKLVIPGIHFITPVERVPL